jgi:hypothetical protein
MGNEEYIKGLSNQKEVEIAIDQDFSIMDEHVEDIKNYFKNDYDQIDIYSISDFIDYLKDNEYYDLNEEINISSYTIPINEVLDYSYILHNKNINGEINIYKVSSFISEYNLCIPTYAVVILE